MRSNILKSLAVAAIIATTAPAFAAPTTTMLKYDAKTQKYCVTDPAVTGSRIERITCKTSAEWTAAGLDMPKPAAADATRLAQK